PAIMTTTTNQTLRPAAIRTRPIGVEPNALDKAATTMAAEAVNSMEPIRSVFISYSFLFNHPCIYTFHCKKLFRSDRGSGRSRLQAETPQHFFRTGVCSSPKR